MTTSRLARPFDDVDPASTHGRAIETVADAGIIRGCAEQQFCPHAPIERARAASLIARALTLEATGVTPRFVDVGSGSHHAASIGAVAEARIMQGVALVKPSVQPIR